MTNNNMCNTTTLAMLYVKELSTDVNPRNGKEYAKVLYGTWCTGIKMNNVLYVKQVSLGDLMNDNEVLIVHTGKCAKYSHSREYAAFEAFAFETEPDQLPFECHELEIVDFDELDSDIQEALLSAMEVYGDCRVGA